MHALDPHVAGTFWDPRAVFLPQGRYKVQAMQSGKGMGRGARHQRTGYGPMENGNYTYNMDQNNRFTAMDRRSTDGRVQRAMSGM